MVWLVSFCWLLQRIWKTNYSIINVANIWTLERMDGGLGLPRKKEDFLLGLVLVVLSMIIRANIFFWDKSLPNAGGGIGVSPSFFPSFAVSVLGVLGFCLIVCNYSGEIINSPLECFGGLSDFKKNKTVLLLVLINFAYVFAIVFAGYYIATFAYMLILGYFAGNKNLTMLGVSIGQLVVIHFFFEKLLVIQLPKGFF